MQTTDLKEGGAKARILDQAMALFMKRGVRSVTMDDIAQDLGISKKTIYQHFQNKAEIVREVTKRHCLQNEAEFEEIAKSAQNAIDELVHVMLWLVQTLKEMAPNLIYDIQKYYPDAWETFHHYENEFVLVAVIDNLKRGIQEGLYREDLNVEIVSRMRVAQVDLGFDETLFPRKQFAHLSVQVEMLKFYIHGITTPKGKEALEAYFQQYNLS